VRRSVVIACEVLRDQLEALGPVPHASVYLPQGLHRTPKILKEQLQAAVDDASSYDVVLLGYGRCSDAVVGVRCGARQTLVVPRAEDCIALSLGTRARYQAEFLENPGTYYFTKGWVETGNDPLTEYHVIAAKHGMEVAEWTCRACLRHYQRTVLITTQPEVDEPARAYAKSFARFFRLRYEEVPGSADYLSKLLLGPWDDDFVTIRDGRTLDDDGFTRRNDVLGR
jgi:hypothetical protein